jgi:hypothetical protein
MADDKQIVADAETAAVAEEESATGRTLALAQLVFAYGSPATAASSKDALKASILTEVQALSEYFNCTALWRHVRRLSRALSGVSAAQLTRRSRCTPRAPMPRLASCRRGAIV